MGVGTDSGWAPGASDLEPQEAGRDQVEPFAGNVFRSGSIRCAKTLVQAAFTARRF